jgi:hypothetical protein
MVFIDKLLIDNILMGYLCVNELTDRRDDVETY